ncbi:MAG TPA: ABC transporter permease [Conexibacter sp.]|jgi:peptide/nickel transport system permease protein|nr:ABC transporter permease [Conexibacter sp.]
MSSRFVLGRVAALAATLLVASFVIYVALYLAPGDPVTSLIGGTHASPSLVAQIRHEHHLDDPLFVGYARWLTSALHGDFGQSLVFRDGVGQLIGPRVGTTLLLVAYAAVLILVTGIGLGILAALRAGRLETTIVVGTTVAMGAPTFVMAIILIALFANNLGWFPVFGAGEGFGDRIWHLTLPAIALAFSYVAYVSQVTRAAVREELRGEYVETARSRGLPERFVVRRHVLRNAMGPIANVSGLTVAGLIAGTVVAERAFGINGLGSLLVDAAARKDLAVVQAIALMMVAAFVVINTLVDLLSAALDPRLAQKAVA